MTISGINPGERVKDVRFTEDTLSVDIIDGRTITVPLAWYPRLLHATPEQRRNLEICGGGCPLYAQEGEYQCRDSQNTAG